MAQMPPILHVADLTDYVFADIREASNLYCHKYNRTDAFEKLTTDPERRNYIASVLAGQADGEDAVRKLRKWILGPWASARSVTEANLPQIGCGLLAGVAELRSIPSGTGLADANGSTIEAMVRAFSRLGDCPGVGGTIASKVLSALRPDLFMIWDKPIAQAYGFDSSVAGYRRFLQLMAPATRRMRELWGSRTPSLEEHLKPTGREWQPPLTKIVDEWHWIRITRKHAPDA